MSASPGSPARQAGHSAAASPVVDCPACGSDGEPIPVLTLPGVPANSVRLHHDADSARACSRGDIALVACPDCGFAWNRAFDPRLVDYSPGYEATQAHSPTFNRFHAALASDLVERHSLHGKRVVEIGCGEGEFLALLCRLGGNVGIGCDPAFSARPAAHREGLAIAIAAVPFDRFTHQPGDFYCTKMTLEHLAPPATLLSELRRTLDGAPGTPVFVQVPNAARILEGGAFWDVYHEHCNYFATASLTRLMERTGYRVTRAWTDFNDQYLMADAVVVSLAGPAPPACRPAPGDRSAAVPARAAAGRMAGAIAAWQGWLADMHAAGGRVALWGGGSKAVGFMSAIGAAPAIVLAIDINPRKDGTWLAGSGLPVCAPARLREQPVNVVVAMNGHYESEIAAALGRLGVPALLRAVDQGPPKDVWRAAASIS